MSTRLENLVCAVLKSGIVQPLAAKISLRVLGTETIVNLNYTKEEKLAMYDAFSAEHDREVAKRAVEIAKMIDTHIADIELKELSGG